MASRGIFRSFLALAWVTSSVLADTVTFTNGDTLRGTIVSEDDERLVFRPTALPQNLEIPRSSVEKVERDELVTSPEENEEPGPPSEPVVLSVDKQETKKLVPELPENWKARLGLGFTDRKNQSVETREISANGKLAWKGERQEAEWRAHYQYQSQEGKKSADRYGASQRLRHRGDKSFYVQAETKAEVDHVTKKRSQLSQTAGLGYSPIKEKGLTLNVTPGIKAEVITDAEREEQDGKAYKAHIQQDLRWEMTDRVAIGQGLSYSVDPRNTENWDLDLKAFVETKVSEDVNVRLNYHREFVNQTAGAEDKENSAVGASLVWDF